MFFRIRDEREWVNRRGRPGGRANEVSYEKLSLTVGGGHRRATLK